MNKIICVDAGIVVRRVAFPEDAITQQLWEEWEAVHAHLVAPHLLFFEVTNVLLRYQYLNLMGPLSTQIALAAALALPVELISDTDIHLRAWRIAKEFRLKAAYDAHYLALSERLGADFYTTDQRLIKEIASELPRWVHLIKTLDF